MNLPLRHASPEPIADEAVGGGAPRRRRVLMIAYHFPPLAGSSGIQRTLRFVQQLPVLGWEPLVLTAHPRAYATTSDDLLREVPPSTHVERAFALDTARHLALCGRYPGLAARPDRWVTWWLGAIPAGLRLIRRFRPQAIWTTYPIATAHLIGRTLHDLSGLPWVADFRDPMAQDGYPEDPKVWRSFARVEGRAVRAAAACTFTTPGAVRFYRQRYADVDPERFQLIENGYDEQSFRGLMADGHEGAPLVPGKLTLLHSGIVYPSERDPAPLIAALGRLKRESPQIAARLALRFRAPVHDELLRRLATKHGAQDLVEVLSSIAYREALGEMLRADGLLLLQAANCSDQVPAKLYEYLRARRPIVALTNADGDTARVLGAAGIDTAAPLDDAERIAAALRRFVQDAEWRARRVASEPCVRQASRSARSSQLADLLDRVTDGAGRTSTQARGVA